jgi:3-oxoadipate enol-lactonase
VGADEDKEIDPPALERLAEIQVPGLVLVDALGLDAIVGTALRVMHGIPAARRVDWPDIAHLPSMERPGDFVALLRDWSEP